MCLSCRSLIILVCREGESEKPGCTMYFNVQRNRLGLNPSAMCLHSERRGCHAKHRRGTFNIVFQLSEEFLFNVRVKDAQAERRGGEKHTILN